MDVKGANPFLFNDDDYTSPNSGNSNPFLMGGDDYMSGGNDNPFLAESAVTMAPEANTNPFAFDPMELEPSEGQQANFNFSLGPFDIVAEPVPAEMLIEITPAIIPQKPTDLDLKYTNTVAPINNEGNGLPRRPPPPRPPPSKETQDLLMSVMGEMDAASSHLLDRIPPTRTPSPVSMRDLHSPSPTPEPQFGDLLDVSDAKTETNFQSMQQDNTDDLLMPMSQDIAPCDINQNPPPPQREITPPQIQPQFPPPHVPSPPQNVPPARPGPPVRPPRPVPPQKPPPPSFVPQQPAAPPPKPPPPAIPQHPPKPPQQQQRDDIMDMFGSQPPPPKSTADIMNLYVKQETPVDLLSDSIEPEPVIAASEAADSNQSETNSRKSSVPSSDNTVINANNSEIISEEAVTETPITPPQTQENYLSPQADMQMDTSDSQSKESISSVTFNPFAAVEETSPTNPSTVPMQDFGGIDNGVYQQDNTVQNDNFQMETTKNAFPNEVYEEKPDNFEPVEKEHHIFGTAPAPNNRSNVFVNETSTAPSTDTSNIFGTTTDNTFGMSNEIFGTNPAPKAFDSSDTFGSNLPSDSFGMSVNSDTYGVASDTFGTTDNSAFGNSFRDFGPSEPDEFDAFSAKFESARDENKNGAFDAFGASADASGGGFAGGETWGNEAAFNDSSSGFGNEETFDAFLAMKEPPAVPQSTPNRFSKAGSLDSDEEKDFSVVIRPKSNEESFGGALPCLAPPPAPPAVAAFSDASRINPFDQNEYVTPVAKTDLALPLAGEIKRTDSQESPPTPLYDEDTSQPLEDFPRIDFKEEGWELHLRQPNKKKITGQRFWKKIFVRIVYQQDCVLLQLFNQQTDKDPFQELPLQPCYSVSDIGAQQYDNFGKIFTLKLQYIFYKERPGVRPGQVKKAERITNKLSQFAAYAIQGDYQGCKEFGSDLKKLGLPVEHAPQVSQLMKLGSLNFEDLKQFSVSIEEALFKLQAHRDRALHYKMEEVQVTAVDELYVEQDAEGHIEKQIARVRLFFLGFLTGMPDIELGINDMRRQGKEVVGRHDIIPVVTEEWIRLEKVEFHNSVQQDEYNDTHIIKFKPPDACYIELLRFRVRPPKNRELPLQLKAQICITGNKVELRADVLVPGFASRKLGQVPCEDVMIRFPIPECWIYMFRVEKHFRYGSVKSAHRRTGKIKGIERILGTVDTLQESLIEVTSGQAKYEHQHRAIVWRCPRLPKEGQGAYTTHNMVCKLSLTGYDQMPDQLADYAYVEFTMPATQVSHTTVRSVSLQNSDSDEPPEKYVRYLARHEYRVGIEHTEGEGPGSYLAATQVSKPAPPPIPEEKPKPIPEAESSSDSD